MADNNVKIVIDYIVNGAKDGKSQTEDMKQATKDFGIAAQKAASLGEVFKKSVDGIKKASASASGVLSKFAKSISRILLYRSVRKLLSETAQAFKEGTNNIYAYSDALNNADSTHAKSNLDSLATSILYVKNCLGSILAPIIQYITPLVYQMADAFAVASRSIAQVFSALAGNSTFTYAKRFGTQFADSLSSASGSAKEIKRTLMGFDEINRLDAPDSSSGSGSSSSIDASNMFDKGTISEKAKKIGETIKKVVLPIITTLGSAIAGIFVGSKIATFTSSLAQTFGVTEKLATSIGKVAGGITLIVSGIALIVYGVYDVINTGGSLKSWLAILSGIALVVVGVAMAFGGIPALITGIVLLVGTLGLLVATHWEEIKAKGAEVIASIKTKLSELWQKILQVPIIGTIANWVGTIIEGVVKAWNKIQEIKAKIWEIFFALVGALANLVYSHVIQPIIGWLSKAASWVNEHVIQPVIDFFRPIATAVGDFISGAVEGAVNGTFSLIENAINGFIKMLNYAIVKINKIPGVKISKVSEVYLPRLANGGFVNQGQLFIANEAGAEMVGSMNGRTTVANNQQIVEGIKQGVMEAMQNSGNQNIVLNVDGKQLFDIMVGRNNSMVRTTGRSPLLV